MENLRAVSISLTDKVQSLSGDVVGINTLQRLDLSASTISSLPSSIGKLLNLKELNLAETEKLLTLPNAIGNLTNLHKPTCSDSGIASIPKPIGNLKNLDLCYTAKLQSIPSMIGNLVNLNVLRIYDSSMHFIASQFHWKFEKAKYASSFFDR